MADNARKLISLVRNDTTALLQGEITRLVADNAVRRAQADNIENAVGLAGFCVLGAGPDYLFDIATAGEALMRPEVGLTLTAGETLYVSENVAGRVTNVAPSLARACGIVKDTTPYATVGLVMGLVRFCCEGGDEDDDD